MARGDELATGKIKLSPSITYGEGEEDDIIDTIWVGNTCLPSDPLEN